MLQRLPVILAVTAASYGLPAQAQAQGQGQAQAQCSSRGSASMRGAAAMPAAHARVYETLASPH